jgi:hypothetical protein
VPSIVQCENAILTILTEIKFQMSIVKYLQEPDKCVQIMLIYVRNSLCQRH